MMPFRLTPAVKALLIASLAVFVLQQVVGPAMIEWFALIPGAVLHQFRIWQLLTYALLHGDVMHLLLNLLMLVFVGVEIEGLWGTVRFLKYYGFCILAAGVVYVGLQLALGGFGTPLVGASGGIYGLLLAYGLLFGERVLLFMMLFPMKAKHFVWVLAGVEFLTLISSGKGWLASAAHLSGMGAGFAYLWTRASLQIAQKNRAARKAGNDRVRRRRQGGHLKLVIDNDKSKFPESEDDVDHDPKTWH